MESPEQDRSQGALADSEAWLIAPSLTDTRKNKAMHLLGTCQEGKCWWSKHPLHLQSSWSLVHSRLLCLTSRAHTQLGGGGEAEGAPGPWVLQSRAEPGSPQQWGRCRPKESGWGRAPCLWAGDRQGIRIRRETLLVNTPKLVSYERRELHIYSCVSSQVAECAMIDLQYICSGLLKIHLGSQEVT